MQTLWHCFEDTEHFIPHCPVLAGVQYTHPLKLHYGIAIRIVMNDQTRSTLKVSSTVLLLKIFFEMHVASSEVMLVAIFISIHERNNGSTNSDK